MALIEKLTAIGDSFRSSRGTTQQYTLDEMATLAAEKTGITPVGTKEITANGTHDVTEFATVEVNVQDIIDVTELPTENIDTTKYYRIDDKLYKYDDGVADTNNVLGTWTFDSSLLEQKLLQHQDPSDFLKLDCILESSVGIFSGILLDCGALMYFQDPEHTAPTEPAAYIDGGKIECMYFALQPFNITSGSDETLAFLQETATKEGSVAHWDCYYIPAEYVTELPTTDIDPDKYYWMDGKIYKYDDGVADTNNVLGTWTFDLSLLEQKLLQCSDDSNYFIGDCTIECADGKFVGICIMYGGINYYQDTLGGNPAEPWAFIDGDKIYVERAAQQTITITSGSDEVLALLQETATKEAGTPHWDCYYIPKLEALTVTPRATDHIITPNYGKDGLSKVTIKGDSNLVPTNIKKDVTIFGVKGTNAPNLQEKTVTVNGEATPDEGYDGLSKVTVDVPSITEIATASEMTALLTEENINRLYRFTGTTNETYINGDLYEVMSK